MTRARERLADDLRVALPPFLASRALVGLGWLLAVAVADRFYAVRPVQLRDGLLAWDGTWYRDIAQSGYGAVAPQGLRFFPVYPLAGRVLGGPFGETAVSVALLLIANLAALGLAVAVRRLVQREGFGVAAADRATWAITLFPSAFVLVWAYAESVMLLAAVGAFLAARRRRWWWAALAGLVAGGARPVGMAVAAGLAVEAVRGLRGTRWPERVARAAAVVAPVAGAAAYLMWVGRLFGRWSIPFDVQTELRGEANPVSRLVAGFRDLFGVERFGDGLHVPFAVAFVVLLVITFRRWPASYGVYATVVLVAALSAANLNSIERYALDAFPLVLTFAVLLRRPRWERLGLAVCGSGFVALTALAWLGVYVP